MSFYVSTVPPEAHNKGNRSDCSSIAKYIYDNSVKLHPAQEKLIERSNLESKNVMLGAPDEMQLFQNLLKLMKAKRTLDIGVFTGFSALSVALALPDDGQVIALDITDEYLKRCGTFDIWKEAGVAHKINFRLGNAVESLQRILAEDGEGSFDFAFIDADKEQYAIYYEFAVKLVRQGGIIAVDNTLWGGSVIDTTNHEPATLAIKALNKKIANDGRVSVSFLPVADGVSLCFKK